LQELTFCDLVARAKEDPTKNEADLSLGQDEERRLADAPRL